MNCGLLSRTGMRGHAARIWRPSLFRAKATPAMSGAKITSAGRSFSPSCSATSRMLRCDTGYAAACSASSDGPSQRSKSGSERRHARRYSSGSRPSAQERSSSNASARPAPSQPLVALPPLACGAGSRVASLCSVASAARAPGPGGMPAAAARLRRLRASALLRCCRRSWKDSSSSSGDCVARTSRYLLPSLSKKASGSRSAASRGSSS
mmetsp:Transcript_98346/g.306259  ORF Transcript_98346/g.306259 Transcript_98346/m.306259 type:complete len:209 (-) Transcript_98346:96-722(-)